MNETTASGVALKTAANQSMIGSRNLSWLNHG